MTLQNMVEIEYYRVLPDGSIVTFNQNSNVVSTLLQRKTNLPKIIYNGPPYQQKSYNKSTCSCKCLLMLLLLLQS